MSFIMLCLAFLSLPFNAPSSEHDFHVGIVQMEYSEKSKTYQVAIKLFTDDLEKAIYESTGEKLRLGSDKELENADKLIFQYVQARFQLIDNKGKALTLMEIGFETEMDLTWIYLESEKTKPISNLSVKSDIFFEVFTDQTFLIHFNQGGETRSLYLHSGKNQDSFE
jgi:hypothetical protein